MCLYLSLSALHVSDSLVHHQERRFGAVYSNWYKSVGLVVARRTGLYQLRCTDPKVAPDDGLKSPKHVENLMINKDTL